MTTQLHELPVEQLQEALHLARLREQHERHVEQEARRSEEARIAKLAADGEIGRQRALGWYRQQGTSKTYDVTIPALAPKDLLPLAALMRKHRYTKAEVARHTFRLAKSTGLSDEAAKTVMEAAINAR